MFNNPSAPTRPDACTEAEERWRERREEEGGKKGKERAEVMRRMWRGGEQRCLDQRN